VHLAVLVALCGSTVSAGYAGAEEKPVLAVMEIRDGEHMLKEATRLKLTEYLRGRAAESGVYVVVDQGRQSDVFRRMVKKGKKESYRSCYDRSCQVPLGRALAADKILAASIMRLGTSLVVKAEVVDLASEASESAATEKVAAEPLEGLEDRVVDAVDRIVERLCGGASNGGNQAAASRPSAEGASGSQSPTAERQRAISPSKLTGSRVEQPSAVTNGSEKGRVHGPDFWRNKTDWFAVDGLISNMGAGLRVGLVTLRRSGTYIECLQGSVGKYDSFHGTMGVGAGFAFYPESSARHEIRVGSDLDVLMVLAKHRLDEEDNASTRGIVSLGVSPYVRYVYQAEPLLSLRVGFEAMIPVIPYGMEEYLAGYAMTVGLGM